MPASSAVRLLALSLLCCAFLPSAARAHIINNDPDSAIDPPTGQTLQLSRPVLPLRAVFDGDCGAPTRLRETTLGVYSRPAVRRLSLVCRDRRWRWRGEITGMAARDTVTVVLDFEQWPGDRGEHHFHGRDATWEVTVDPARDHPGPR